jgi:hypothetical protein
MMKSLDFRGAWLTPLLTRGALLTVTMILGLLLAAGTALADTVIDTTPQANEQICEFGYPDGRATATNGQVITAPADDTQLDSFTFFIAKSSGTIVMRGEVYAWDGQKATGPNLFESAPRTVSIEGVEEVTFETGGVQLDPGQQYVLFATISKDYESSDTSGCWQAVFPGDAYPGGYFVFMNNGADFDQLLTNPWDIYFDFDLAFKAEFSTSASDSPTTTAECMNNGWKAFENPDGSPMFKNQGDCVSFVASQGKNVPNTI